MSSWNRMAMAGCAVAALVFAAPLGKFVASAQSLSYTKGQGVTPGYEGWEEDPNGARFFVFGYMNKNWEEELDVAVGPDNGFAPGDADRGQPTHFLPRRNRFVFRVGVPQGFGEKDELVWTLTANGRTTKAYASLRPDYKIDDVVKASETGALGAGTSSPTVRSNKPPSVQLEGPRTRSAKVGEAVSLVATVTDDGIPKSHTQEEFTAALAARARALGTGPQAAAAQPQGATGERPAAGAAAGAPAQPPPSFNPFLLPPSRVTVGKNLGLHLSWFVYRGAGSVHFDPDQIKTWEDTRVGANSPWAPVWFAPPLPADHKLTTQVRFDSPGTYVLRALADDGALTSSQDVTVTVTR